MKKRQKVIGRLHNDADHEHVEKFRGDEIRIPARGHIEMPYTDAVQFKGQFYPVLDGKKIRLEMIKPPDLQEALKDAMEYRCPKCDKAHQSDEGLNDHIEAEHFDDLDEEVQKAIVKKRKTKAASGQRGAATA